MKFSENVQIVKDASVILLKEALLGVFIKWIPSLAFGPLNYVAVKLATKLAEELAERGELLLFFEHIDFRTNNQGKDFVAAMIRNHNAQISGSSDEKQAAENELIITANIFITLSK